MNGTNNDLHIFFSRNMFDFQESKNILNIYIYIQKNFNIIRNTSIFQNIFRLLLLMSEREINYALGIGLELTRFGLK